MHEQKTSPRAAAGVPRLYYAAGAALALIAALGAAPDAAVAKEIYARQLGMACAACHQQNRESEGINGLNSYGRAFLDNGRVPPAGQAAPAYSQPAPQYQQPAPQYQPAPGYQQPAPGYPQAAPAYQPSAGMQSSAISWYDGRAHLAVYTASGGVVTERGWEEGGQPWVGRTFPGTSVGATTWNDGEGRHIRVFVSNNGQITEYSFDRVSWRIGPLSVPGRNPAITSWMDSRNHLHHRLYVERNDGRLAEYTWDQEVGRWMGGQ